jgi:hypothetical protein
MPNLYQKPTNNLVMKKFLLIIVISVVPFITMAQSTDVKDTDNVKTTVKTEVAINKVEPISIDPKTQHLDLNHKKSNDIISIKAYIKTLQLKRKATVTS